MKNTTYKFSLVSLCSIVLFFSSCNNFLEVKPKGIIIPEKLEHYDGILFSSAMIQAFPPALVYSTDDFFDIYDQDNRSVAASAYFWRPGLDPTEQVSPAIWGDYYTVIYYCNVIINKVNTAVDGTVAQKEQLVAEAKVNRASAYFQLLTAFAKAYDPATATTLPGLPLVTGTNVTDPVPARSTIQQVIDLILQDTENAVPHLPKTNKNAFRVAQKGALGLLSRVYLYIGNYEKALYFANKTLEEKHSLLDYNNYFDVWDMPDSELSPELVWMQASSDYSIPVFMLYSEDLTNLYAADDLRYVLLKDDGLKGDYYVNPSGNANFGITYPEIYLTKAEALARNNNLKDALDVLNFLRSKRIQKKTYKALASNNKEQVLKWVLEDRRRELAFRGTRWMDMKRLDLEKRMPRIQRIDTGNGKVMATLEPGSKRYTFQIPARVQQFNRDIVLNEE